MKKGLHFSTKNLGVTRDGCRILRDIDWEVKKGEHWAILGQNGCGKTSLLKCLLGYLAPSAGEIQIAAKERGIKKNEPWDLWKRKFGFVSASVAQQMEPNETGIEIVMSGRYAMINYWQQRTPKELRTDATRVLEKVECPQLANKPWSVLSQGERQRLLIGRALMTEDLQVLVLDEHFLAFIQRLATKKNAPSLLLVTHHVEEIVPAISHALVLVNGLLLARGEKRQVITSRVLSEAFDADLTIRQRLGRYRMVVEDGDESNESIV